MRRWLVPVATALATALLVAYLASLRTVKVERGSLLMETAVRVVAYGPQGRAGAAVEAALAELARLEGLWHPQKPESDVARVNAAAGAAPVAVAPETIEVVTAALEIAAATDGAFDPTIGPLVQAWGFGGESRLPSAAERAAAATLVDWRQVQVNPEAQTLFLARPGMVLDLGAIAKGDAAARAREVLRRQGITAGLVQVGGSVATLGRRPDGEPWSIAIQHPRREQDYLTILSLDEGFVDTAGDYQRYFEHEGVRYHHILDPRTGMPARGLASVTVLTNRGDQADALATAAFVLGPEAGYRFLEQRGVSAILVTTGGEVSMTPDLAGRVQVDVGPWP